MFGYEMSIPTSAILSTALVLAPFLFLTIWVLGLRTVVDD